jgi:hypothetical protein
VGNGKRFADTGPPTCAAGTRDASLRETAAAVCSLSWSPCRIDECNERFRGGSESRLAPTHWSSVDGLLARLPSKRSSRKEFRGPLKSPSKPLSHENPVQLTCSLAQTAPRPPRKTVCGSDKTDRNLGGVRFLLHVKHREYSVRKKSQRKRSCMNWRKPSAFASVTPHRRIPPLDPHATL